MTRFERFALAGLWATITVWIVAAIRVWPVLGLPGVLICLAVAGLFFVWAVSYRRTLELLERFDE